MPLASGSEERANYRFARDAGVALTFANTKDVDEQAELLRGWNQSYVQMSSGAFAGSIAEARFEKIHLFVEQTSTRLFQIGELPAGVCAIGVPLIITGPATFCGASCKRGALHIFSGRDGFEFEAPNGLLIAGIVVPEEMLANANLSTEALSEFLDGKAVAHLRSARAADSQSFGTLIQSVIDALRAEPSLADNTQTIETLNKTLMGSLASALSRDDLKSDRHVVAPSKRWKIITEARRILLENSDRPITVADLCRDLRTSRRTLQYCFQDRFGFGPAAYLRRFRLDGARRAMKTAESVTQAATQWGFWHFGRFAHDYKEMYGELPSETFRRFRYSRRRSKAPHHGGL